MAALGGAMREGRTTQTVRKALLSGKGARRQ